MQTISAASATVQPISPARRRTGIFARQADPRAITTVELVNGRIGHQVGPMGRVYADRAAAVAMARNVEGRMARIGGAL